MKKSVLSQIAAIEAMSAKDLAKEWVKYFDYPPQSRCSQSYLASQIIYRIQEITYGGLSKQTQKRLEDLANNKQRFNKKPQFAVGTILIREVKGMEHSVTVLPDGFEYNGIKYKSLSGVAFAITGTRWNGNKFFGVGAK